MHFFLLFTHILVGSKLQISNVSILPYNSSFLQIFTLCFWCFCCTTMFCSWPYTFHSTYDQVFCSAWKRWARMVSIVTTFLHAIWTNRRWRTTNQKGITFVQILIISVTLIVIAIPEGPPLVVMLALAFATKQMTYEKLLMYVLGSCATIANTSVICTNKMGTLCHVSCSWLCQYWWQIYPVTGG